MPFEGTATAPAPVSKGARKDYENIAVTTNETGRWIKILFPATGLLVFIVGVTMYSQVLAASEELGGLLIVGSVLLAAFGFSGGTIVCGLAHTMQILLDNRSK